MPPWRVVRWVFLPVALLAVVALAGVAIAAYVYWPTDLPPAKALEEYAPSVGSRVYAGDDEFITEFQAEKRIFIIANNSDGYGIDQCLAAGDRCGAAAASALCRSRQFARAETFGRLDRKEITGGVPKEIAAGYCEGRGCPEIVAITCAR